MIISRRSHTETQSAQRKTSNLETMLIPPCREPKVRCAPVKTLLKKFLILQIILLFISCKSTPNLPGTAFLENQNFPLNSGGSVYIFADVKQARPIIDLIPISELKDRQARQMLDRTDFFSAAFFPQGNSSNLHLQLAAWGNYPKFWAGIAFRFSRNWKKRQTAENQSYWYSQKDGLSISLGSKQAFAAASMLEDAPLTPFAAEPFAEIPEGFVDFRNGSPLSCWIDNPAPLFSQILKNSGVPLNFPVRQLFVNLYPVEQNEYEALIRMQFDNALQARSMAAVFSLAGSFMADDAISAVFFANPPVINGGNIDIKTSVLSESGIALLLEMFLLYLR